MNFLLSILITFYSFACQTATLFSEGYSLNAAMHISLVENNIIHVDSEYTALIND